MVDGQKEPEISIILPCRNEEKAIGICIDNIKEIIKENELDAEIIVSDSSKDSSPLIAEQFGVNVVKHNKKGYGIAYLEAFKEAKGKYIFMADCDGTYDFSEILRFVNYLREGYDMVIGNRFAGNLQEGSMPWLHKHVGNPFLSYVLRWFFGANVHDTHCGMRAITREALNQLELKTTGMEFASEMIVKAVVNRLRIKEIPINYAKRIGNSKLRSFSDGWRHLRFLLMYAPNHLFIIPGLFSLIFGFFIMILFLLGPVKIFGVTFYNRPILLGSFFTILGYQIISLGIYSKVYMKSTRFIKSDKVVDALASKIKLESGILIGSLVLILAFMISIWIMSNWALSGFPEMKGNELIVALTFAIIGIQTIFSSFFLSMMLIERQEK